MQEVVICSSNIRDLMPGNDSIARIEIDGVPVWVALIETPDIPFDRKQPEHKRNVLVRKLAFSYNYREKGLMLAYSGLCQKGVAEDKVLYYALGSDFLAEVVAVGSQVEGLKTGDRVIGNAGYPYSGVPGVKPGIPSNNASKELEVLHEAKLMKIPGDIPIPQAAALTVGGQTTYQMIRKLELKPHEHVLLTAAKSNTSLFALQALRSKGVNCYGLSTSAKYEQELLDMGMKELIVIDPAMENFAQHQRLVELAAAIEGFDAVIDPFVDLHLGRLTKLLGQHCRYIFCGNYDQHTDITGESFQFRGQGIESIMRDMVIRNIRLIGNCLGQTSDLRAAVQDLAHGKTDVITDHLYTGNQVKEFFTRTFLDTNRFGKVVYQF